jgi:hypothetical protein
LIWPWTFTLQQLRITSSIFPHSFFSSGETRCKCLRRIASVVNDFTALATLQWSQNCYETFSCPPWGKKNENEN